MKRRGLGLALGEPLPLPLLAAVDTECVPLVYLSLACAPVLRASLR
jgi:hypothetical protein